MIKQLNGNEEFNNTSIIEFLYKYRKPLIIVFIVALVASIIFSSPWFITPKYRSSVIMFPAATNSVSKVLISQNSGVKEDILGFGVEEQAEQMLQILNSNLIRDKIVEKYNLMHHYDINPESNYKYTKLIREYENNVRFRRTEYMAVKVSVLDTDPQMAADIANDIAALVDSVKNAMQRERSVKAFEIVRNEYDMLNSEVEDIVDSLRVLGEMGVNDYERQSEVLNEQLAISIRSNDNRGAKILQEKLDKIGKYGGTYLSLKNSLEFKTQQLTLLKAKYQEAKVDAEQELPQKFVVNSAFRAEMKSYPIRSIIVLVSVFSALFLTILVILTIDNISRLDLKKKVNLKPGFSLPSFKVPEYKAVVKEEAKEIPKEEAKEIAKEVAREEKIVKPEKQEKINTGILNMEKYFDNSNIIQLLWRWKLHLAIIVLAAIILSAIFSGPFFITPKFKSLGVVYPANISEYSDESPTEQMFQIFQSQDIKDSVIERFDLPAHYKIDRNYKYYRTIINYEYSQNVKINKTPYEAISIEVFDEDPQMASDIVLAIIDFYNKKVASLHKGKYHEVLAMYELLLANKQTSIDSLKARLYDLSRDKGLLAYEQTSEQVMKGYLQTIMGGSKSNINMKEVEKLKTNMEKYGGELISITELLKQEARTYADFKVEYEDTWRFYNADLTYCNIISYPFPADKKAYPIRWLIVAISTIVTFVLAIVLIIIFENYRRIIRKQDI